MDRATLANFRRTRRIPFELYDTFLEEAIWGGLAYGGKVRNVAAHFGGDIRAAIEDLPGSGGTVYVPQGIYNIDYDAITRAGEGVYAGSGDVKVAINVPSNTTIIMDRNAILRADPSTDAFSSIFWIYDKTNVTIIGGRLIGDRGVHFDPDHEWLNAITIAGSTDVTIQAVYMQDFQGSGVWITPSLTPNWPSNALIDHCHLYRNYHQGLTIAGGNQVVVQNTKFELSGYGYTDGRPAIDIESDGAGAVLGTTSHVIVDKCYLEDGIWIQAIQSATIDNITVTNNHIIDGVLHGINCLESVGTLTNLHLCDNRVDNSAEIGIHLSTVTGPSVISGNEVSKSGHHGINPYEAFDVIISGNTVIASSQDADNTHANIRLRSASASGNILIEGNLVHQGGETNKPDYGIEVHLLAGSHGVVQNNIVVDGGKTAPIVMTSGGEIHTGNVGGDETVTTGAPTLQPWGYTELDSSGGAITATLPGGHYIGQTKTIVMTDATTSSTVSATNHETSDPEVATFDAVDETWVLVWTGTEWATLKATCTFL